MISDTFTRFQQTRQRTLDLTESLAVEDYVVQPIFDVSPIKWHLAHTTWFFETFVLMPNKSGYRPFHPEFGFLFNSYYNTAGDRVPKAQRGLISRPTVSEIRDYRQHVDAQMAEMFTSGDVTETLRRLIQIGIEHEEQHQELLVYDIKYIYFVNPLETPYRSGDLPETRDVAITFITVPGGTVSIGHTGDGFGFDNEQPRHEVLVTDFNIANRPVTNGEFLEFIEDGQYQSPVHWLDDAWHWIQQDGIQTPLYWRKIDDEWQEWTFYGWQTLRRSDTLQHISLYEADAFAAWAGARLPTEFEWETAATRCADAADANFVDDKRFHVRAPGDASVSLTHGNVWEWTNSAYLPYPGYKKPAGAIGEYNGKFMSGQMVLRGGSYATAKAHYRHSYRNFFQPDKRWLIAGVRLAKDA